MYLEYKIKKDTSIKMLLTHPSFFSISYFYTFSLSSLFSYHFFRHLIIFLLWFLFLILHSLLFKKNFSYFLISHFPFVSFSFSQYVYRCPRFPPLNPFRVFCFFYNCHFSIVLFCSNFLCCFFVIVSFLQYLFLLLFSIF